jgi:hypothetical protein
MMTRTEVRPGTETGAAKVTAAAATGPSVPDPADLPPVVTGLVYAPAGARRWSAVLVERCHWCAGAHLHRTPRVPSGLITRWCTVSNRRYLIMPAVVRTTGRRRKAVRR